MRKIPKTTAGAIIYRINKEKTEVLLTKRNVDPFNGYWCIPGGHVELYEKVENAVKREVKEETNLDFSPEFLCYLDEIFPEREIHNIVMIFFGKAEGNLLKNDDEVSESDWFAIEETLKMELAFNHNEALNIFYQNKIK